MKLISFSLWGDDPKYFQGAIENLKLLPEIYPGWTCVFYMNRTYSQFEEVKNIAKNCMFITPPLAHKYSNMFWRFCAGSIGGCERYIVRDTDSRLNDREADAVREWEESGKPFHIMRDNVSHNTQIPGGMWGATFDITPDVDNFFHSHSKVINDYKQWDQIFLANYIWPRIKDNHVAHDSIHNYTGSERLFKVSLPPNQFVGQDWTADNKPIVNGKPLET